MAVFLQSGELNVANPDEILSCREAMPANQGVVNSTSNCRHPFKSYIPSI